MKEKKPGFVEKIEKLGLRYITGLSDGNGLHPEVKSWQEYFETTDRKKAESIAATLQMTIQWPGDYECIPEFPLVKVSSPILEGVKVHPRTKEKVWFNHLILYQVPPVHYSTYGDGSPLDSSDVATIIEEMNPLSIAFPWQHGDVLLVDNILIQHSRRPFKRPREIRVMLTK